MSDAKKLAVGVIGCGYWGPNLVRNFQTGARSSVKYACDLDAGRLRAIGEQFPMVRLTSKVEDLLSDPELGAVVVATPVETHHRLARAALLAGKHVLVEKPLTGTVAEGEELVALARGRSLVLACDHTFLFTGAVRKIKSLVESGALGKLLYFDSVRVNLGLFQPDVNVLWDLAPHDLAILDFLIGKLPRSVSAVGACHAGNRIENMAYLTLQFDEGLLAHIHVNWLAPVKIRQIIIGGTEKMVLWDDTQPSEKLKVYDRGITLTRDDRYQTLISYRTGDMWSPKLDQTEALRLLADHFVDCILDKKEPIVSGEAGLRVVRILEASKASIKEAGTSVPL